MPRREHIRELIEGLQKYELCGDHNEGANSYSFFAKHLPLGVRAFLKAWDVDPSSDDLYREARLLKEISEADPGRTNLVRVLDAERLDEETVLLAMEHVDGGSLLHQMQEHGPFALMDALKITTGILHGVAHLHARELVHRDLKPANVLMDPADFWPKIGDFGSVAQLNENGSTSRKSQHSALYIPPEGWKTPAEYAKPSDLYQVGVTAYELINGPLPYDYDSHLDKEALRDLARLGATCIQEIDDPVERDGIVNRAIFRRASRRKLLGLTPHREYVPDAVTRILRKATSPNAADRYQTASDFIAAIEHLDFPNWHVRGDEFHATNWRGADWIVREEKSGEFVALRRISGGYRSWKTASSARLLIDSINEREP